MDWLVVWGWVCAIAGTLAALPQVVRLLRIRSSAGLALLLWQLNLGAGVGWVVHGFALGYANVIVPNILISATNVAVLVLIQRDRRLRWRQVWVLSLAVAAACVVVEFTLPPGSFGLAALVPHSIGLLAQTRDLVRAPSIDGVSPVFLANTMAIQYLWFVWGFFVGDLSVVWCAGALAVLATINVVVLLGRRFSAHHAGPDADAAVPASSGSSAPAGAR